MKIEEKTPGQFLRKKTKTSLSEKSDKTD